MPASATAPAARAAPTPAPQAPKPWCEGLRRRTTTVPMCYPTLRRGRPPADKDDAIVGARRRPAMANRAATTASTLRIEPIDASFGAIVSGFRIADLDEPGFRELYAAWLKYALLVFPGQYLKREEQIAFAKRFGSLEFE